jgi:hypothetical protein
MCETCENVSGLGGVCDALSGESPFPEASPSPLTLLFPLVVKKISLDCRNFQYTINFIEK